MTGDYLSFSGQMHLRWKGQPLEARDSALYPCAVLTSPARAAHQAQLLCGRRRPDRGEIEQDWADCNDYCQKVLAGSNSGGHGAQ